MEAPLQVYPAIATTTATGHFTYAAESSYISLYLLVILLGSILLPRSQAFTVAAVSFICMGSLLEFAYLPTIYPGLADRYPTLRFLTTSSPVPVDLGTLPVKIVFGLFACFAV